MSNNQDTTRYYYTDPLAAAWMAKHFGMHFDCDDAETPWDICASTMCQSLTEDDEPYYIHPDSVHLLEPMAGDVLAIPSWPEGKYGFLNVCQQQLDENMKDADLTDSKIILRKNLPFHWPEVEK